MQKNNIVVCLPGFNNSDVDRKPLFKGGTGYEEGRIVRIKTVDEIMRNETSPIIWTFCGRGIWGQAVRLATTYEIQAFEKGITNIKDINYESEYY